MKYLLIIFAFIILRSNAFAQNNDPDQSGCPYEETVELTYYSGSIKYFGELGEVLYEESYTMMEDDFCEGWYSSDYWECYSYPVTVLETQTFWRECPPEPLSPQTAYATVRDEDLESDYPLTIT